MRGRGVRWTPEEDAYLREHYKSATDAEIAGVIDRTESAVIDRRNVLGIRRRNWAPEEIAYLEERWGVISTPAIAKHLGRSINAIKLKAVRIGLPGDPINASELITFRALILALGKTGSYAWTKERWARFGLPIKYKVMMKMRIAMIRVEDFWTWAEQHQDILDFSDFEEYALGAEPDWAKEKRRRDIRQKINRTPWTREPGKRICAPPCVGCSWSSTYLFSTFYGVTCPLEQRLWSTMIMSIKKSWSR